MSARMLLRGRGFWVLGWRVHHVISELEHIQLGGDGNYGVWGAGCRTKHHVSSKLAQLDDGVGFPLVAGPVQSSPPACSESNQVISGLSSNPRKRELERKREREREERRECSCGR